MSLTGALSTDATTASAPGSHAIQQGSLSASANYDLTYVGASLTVQASGVVPADEAASTAAYDLASRGNGAPPPIIFSRAVPGEDRRESALRWGHILPGHRDDLQHMRLGVGRAGR